MQISIDILPFVYYCTANVKGSRCMLRESLASCVRSRFDENSRRVNCEGGVVNGQHDVETVPQLRHPQATRQETVDHYDSHDSPSATPAVARQGVEADEWCRWCKSFATTSGSPQATHPITCLHPTTSPTTPTSTRLAAGAQSKTCPITVERAHTRGQFSNGGSAAGCSLVSHKCAG